MLKGISPLISPDLLKALAEMGHGDEIVLADAHFPGHSLSSRVLRADGIRIPALLDAILPLFELDGYERPLVMMSAVEGDQLDPQIEIDYHQVLRRHALTVTLERMDRFAFYERARGAYTVLMTGDTRKYANIIMKKGVTPSAANLP